MSNLFEETPQENVENETANATAEATSQQGEVKQPETSDPNSLFVDRLQHIKTQDGRQKYADVATALDSIPHAQNKINELSSKIETLEQELQKRSGMEDMLQQLQSSQNTPKEQPSSGVLDEQTLASLVDRQLSEREKMAARNANATKVRDALIATYGEKAESTFNSKAKELGVDPAYLSELSMNAPQLVLSHFGASPAPQAQPLIGDTRTNAAKPLSPERKSVMRGASSRDVVEQFKAHKPQ